MHVWPSFLPDGDHFLYLARGMRPESSVVYAGTLSANTPTTVLTVDSNAVFAAGHLLFVRQATLWASPTMPDAIA